MAAENEHDDHSARFVVLWRDNNNWNTFDHVISQLKAHVPNVSDEASVQLALAVRNDGKAVVWQGPGDEAKRIAHFLAHHGLTVSIESSDRDLVPPQDVVEWSDVARHYKRVKLYYFLMLAIVVFLFVVTALIFWAPHY
jgi:ATP-dependent Clp protease adapter protein ClpS